MREFHHGNCVKQQAEKHEQRHDAEIDPPSATVEALPRREPRGGDRRCLRRGQASVYRQAASLQTASAVNSRNR